MSAPSRIEDIAQLYRTFVDEDGTDQWWCNVIPSDRLTGRRMVDANGVEYIEVEHTYTGKPWPWSKSRIETRRTWYSPSEIRVFAKVDA